METYTGSRNGKNSINYSGVPGIYHNPDTRRLFVVKVSGFVLLQNWRPTSDSDKLKIKAEIYYVKSNGIGVINWDNTEVFEAEDLVTKDNVYLVDPGRVRTGESKPNSK